MKEKGKVAYEKKTRKAESTQIEVSSYKLFKRQQCNWKPRF
jgi:hypothetical protein